MEFGELFEELLDGRRRELKLGDAPRQLREISYEDNSRHFTWGPRNGPHTPTRSERPGGPVALLCLASLAQTFAAASRSLSALRTFGGDIGSSVKRMPVAFSMALAIAPSGGMIGVSPTPRTP